MRLRVFDWNARWFWLVVFYQRSYGKPWVEALIFPPQKWRRWFHLWAWEEIPQSTGYEEVEPSLAELAASPRAAGHADD